MQQQLKPDSAARSNALNSATGAPVQRAARPALRELNYADGARALEPEAGAPPVQREASGTAPAGPVAAVPPTTEGPTTEAPTTEAPAPDATTTEAVAGPDAGGAAGLTPPQLTKARAYYAKQAGAWPPAQIGRVCARLGLAPRAKADDAFIQAVAAHQAEKGIAPVDGMAGPDTMMVIFEGADMDRAHTIANAITSKYEGGSYAAYQTLDTGIVSYGKHQTTLASGTLAELLAAYVQAANAITPVSENAKAVAAYLPKVRGTLAEKQALRNDAGFKKALVGAAAEEAMQKAQDAFFTDRFWDAAIKIALEAGITSQLGYATIYDCMIQGGAASVIATTKTKLGGMVGESVPTTIDGKPGTKTITEAAFLSKFNDIREGRLEEIAQHRGPQTAAMLRSSKVRPKALKKLADDGNLGLEANVEGTDELEIGTYKGSKTRVAAPPTKSEAVTSDAAAAATSSSSGGTEAVTPSTSGGAAEGGMSRAEASASTDLGIPAGGRNMSVDPAEVNMCMAPSAAEIAQVQYWIHKGSHDETQLTDKLFFMRHPDLRGKSLAKGSPLIPEWLSIRSDIVQPALAIARGG